MRKNGAKGIGFIEKAVEASCFSLMDGKIIR